MELMIVLMVLAILAGLAYPSYVDYARKARRGEAQQLLMNWAINQEIFRSSNPAYAPDTSTALPKPDHDNYGFEAHQIMGAPASCQGGSGDPDAVQYWLQASASGDQLNDDARDGTSCANLCMAGSGQKEPAVCWE